MAFYPYYKTPYRGKTFRYTGPVYRNGYIIGYWTGDTRAYTIEKAFQNLTFRARREVGVVVEDVSVYLDPKYLAPLYG